LIEGHVPLTSARYTLSVSAFTKPFCSSFSHTALAISKIPLVSRFRRWYPFQKVGVWTSHAQPLDHPETDTASTVNRHASRLVDGHQTLQKE
jgi:hypothetical protein